MLTTTSPADSDAVKLPHVTTFPKNDNGTAAALGRDNDHSATSSFCDLDLQLLKLHSDLCELERIGLLELYARSENSPDSLAGLCFLPTEFTVLP